MKLTENMDTTAHITEMEAHFCLMQERVDKLTVIGDHRSKNILPNHTQICAWILSCYSSDHQHCRHPQQRKDHSWGFYNNILRQNMSSSHPEGWNQGPNASVATSWVTNCQTVLLLEVERRAKVLNRRVRRAENRETQQIPQMSLASWKQRTQVKPCLLSLQPHHFTVLLPSLVSISKTWCHWVALDRPI